jgi:putative cell wall-binding protein
MRGEWELKKLVTILLAVLLLAVPLQATMAEGTNQTQTNVNPQPEVINKLLTEAALKYDIPPEIVKAVAISENGKWEHFGVNGETVISDDGGIGLMQITDSTRDDLDQLKASIEYNIQEGVKILNKKFESGILPVVNENDRHILESWYFAILAYNGQVQVNSPLKRETGEVNEKAYQEEAFGEINRFNPGMDVSSSVFNFKTTDFTYMEEAPYLLKFNKQKYEIPENLLHTSKYFYKANDIVLTAEGAKLRKGPSTENEPPIKTVTSGTREAVTILGNFAYDNSNVHNSAINMLWKQYAWYNVRSLDGKTGYTAAMEFRHLGKRLSGPTRYETAVAISQQGWKGGSDTVVLAKGTDFPDALAGTPLAHQLNAPLLLTHPNFLHSSTEVEIDRLKAKKVVLLGSPGAITTRVEEKLKSKGLTVVRYGGKDRFETAIKISRALPVKGDTAILANSHDFPDALSIAAYAARNNFPILITRMSTLTPEIEQELKKYKHTIVVGSEGVVSKNIFGKLNDPKRFGGKNRFETNSLIVNGLPLGKEQAYIATASAGKFADALTGAVLAAKSNAPLLLTYPSSTPDVVQSTIKGQGLKYFNFLGGPDVTGVENVIGDLVSDQLYK